MDIVELYETVAHDYDRDRGQTLLERAWLDRFLDLVPAPGTILDIGCGTGEPIARYLIERGHRVVGIDSSRSMIGICRSRFPEQEWVVADMRSLALGRRFDGILAWDSFFHLTPVEQRAMFARFAAHARTGAPLMFTSGPAEGVAIGEYRGHPLYHASLNPDEYERLLNDNGHVVQSFRPEDPECGGHSVWLATFTSQPLAR